MVSSYWLLVIGYWLLVIGYLLFVSSYWLFVIGSNSQFPIPNSQFASF